MRCGIRGGPKELGAASYLPIKTTIEATRVQCFIKNWQTPAEDIGKALLIAMAWTQYSTKVPYPILSETTTNLSYVKGKQ